MDSPGEPIWTSGTFIGLQPLNRTEIAPSTELIGAINHFNATTCVACLDQHPKSYKLGEAGSNSLGIAAYFNVSCIRAYSSTDGA